MSNRWRVGRKLGRTLYRDEHCVGMVDTPELAAEIVSALNGSAPWSAIPVPSGPSATLSKEQAAQLLGNTESAPECTCPVGLVPGNRGFDPNCPQHGRKET